ncbi:protein of unknown function [Cyanobium sp. NIES-981]|nr:protein of unknown function [Cyanobium sp. NIES-981]
MKYSGLIHSDEIQLLYKWSTYIAAGIDRRPHDVIINRKIILLELLSNPIRLRLDFFSQNRVGSHVSQMAKRSAVPPGF